LRPALALVGAAVGLAVVTQPAALLAGWNANLGALHQARRELGGYAWPTQVPLLVRREGDLEGVEQRFRAALALDPEQRTAHQRLAMIALARGQAALAREHLTTALRVEPADPTLTRLLAESYVALGNLPAACQLEREAEARGRPSAWRFGSRLCD
jgi:Tfp pilus assembly protein PilF